MSKKGDNQKNQRIQVFARCRPLNSIERKQGSASIIEVIPEKKEIVLKEKNNSRQYFFDKVFPQDTQQIAVYKSVVAPLIQEVLMGYNCTVFAYGQTGTGKTYTMEGERNSSKCSWEEDPAAGIIPRSLHQLFEELNKEDNVEFSVRVSFLELYNEELFDLLSSSSTELSKLRLYEDTNRKGSVIIQGLEEILVNNKDEVYSILEKGTARRQTAATKLNYTSSRSHTVFSVTVHIKENTVDGEELLKTGKLNLVDLAGSENVGRSGAIDKRAREAGNINQSLLTLGRVITALIEKQPHVPYRESKLTRLLQDSLGGHTKTSIIATISPAQCNFDETISTLDYATKAKSITIKPEVNQKMTKRALIREYTEEIERLRKDLEAARSKDGFYMAVDNYDNWINRTTTLENNVKELSETIEVLTAENTKIEQMFATTKEDLKYSQEVLSKTTLEMNKKQVVINVQQKTGNQLLHQAKTLLQVADETTCDKKGLHAKIERMKTVEKTNEKQLNDFKPLFHKQTAELCEISTAYQKEIDEHLQFLKQDPGKLKSRLNEHEKKMGCTLKTLTNEAQSLRNRFLNHLNERANIEKQWASNLSQDLSSKKDNFSLEVQTFLTQRLPSLLDRLNAESTSKDNWILDIHKNLNDKVTEQDKANRIRRDKMKSLICKMRESLDSFDAKYEACMLNFKKQNQSLSERKNYLNNISNSLAVFAREMTEDTQLEDTCTHFENDKAELKTIQEHINTLDTDVKTSEEDAIAHYTELPDIFKMDEFTQMKDSTLQCHEAVSSEVGEVLGRLQKLQNDSCQQTKATVEYHCTAALEDEQNIKSTVNDNFTSFSNAMDESRKGLKEHVQNLENLSCKSIDVLSKVERKNSETASRLKEEILKRDLEFEKFISEDLVRDIPTGTTPQRKTYDYPRELVSLPEYEEVMQRLNSQPSADTVAFSLDNSFNETGESKCTIDTNSAVSSVDASLTSNSDGCESDSSTVSNISVDGKNKENKKGNKKSRLPKKAKSKQQYNEFVKPAPMSGRKPLHISNPDANSER